MANPAPGYANKPNHRVDLIPDSQHVRVSSGGVVIADTTSAIRVEETGHGPVLYVPEKDMRMELLHPPAHKTYCPFKGECSYWTIDAGGKQAENAVWGYRAPYDEAVGLAGYYAFYPNRVDAIEVT
jgi:uncharacterized protein (DUF427 family)